MDSQNRTNLGWLATRWTFVGGGVLVAVALLASAIAWPSLPGEMVVGWDSAGAATDFAPRPVGALMLPAIAAVLLGVFQLLPRIDPLGANFQSFRGYYNGFVLLMTAFLAGLHGAVLAINLGYDVALTSLLIGFAGLLFLYTGQLLAVADPNWFVGIRTPWTLSSETVWHRTHSLASRLFAILGVLVIGVSGLDLLVLDLGELPILVLAGGAFAIAGGTFAYSYYVYTRLDQPQDHPRG